MTSSDPSPDFPDGLDQPTVLPFTAFGQFGPGRIDLRVFDQDVWWVDRVGQPHRLDAMPFAYLCNVVMFLREHAVSFHRANTLRAATEHVYALLADLSVPPELNLDTLIAQHPLDWLHGTPLMRRLGELIEVAGAPD